MGETPEPMTGRELQAIVRAERDGVPFFVYRDSGGQQRIVRFELERNELTVGRNAAADLRFGWDEEVSGLHAQLEHLAGELHLTAAEWARMPPLETPSRPAVAGVAIAAAENERDPAAPLLTHDEYLAEIKP